MEPVRFHTKPEPQDSLILAVIAKGYTQPYRGHLYDPPMPAEEDKEKAAKLKREVGGPASEAQGSRKA